MTNFYYYQADGGVYGPVSAAQLVEIGAQGRITGQTLAKEADAETWEPVKNLMPDWKDASPATIPVRQLQRSHGASVGFLALTVLVAAIGLFFFLAGHGFSDVDIEKARSDIRAEYQKRDGVSVVDVTLLRKNPRELTGFVKLKIEGGADIVHTCSATMGDDGRQFIWRCTP